MKRLSTRLPHIAESWQGYAALLALSLFAGGPKRRLHFFALCRVINAPGSPAQSSTGSSRFFCGA
jgi:hypothetical protein